MKLTKTMREVFVRAAMQDVPSVDYEEQARSLAGKAVKAAQTAVGIGKVDQDRLCRNWGNLRASDRVSSATIYGYGLTDSEIRTIVSEASLIALMDKHSEQERQRASLETKLRGAIEACTTRKQAAEALPEFEKYLPADGPKAMRTLPTLANVAADFAKAGWPKTTKKAA